MFYGRLSSEAESTGTSAAAVNGSDTQTSGNEGVMPAPGSGQLFDGPDGGYVLDAFVPIGPGVDAGAGPVMRAEVDPTSIETRLQYEVTAAGDANQVVCEILGPNGEQIVDLVPAVEVTPDVSIQRGESGLIANKAGEYRVACAVPAFGLKDETPIVWTVKPGHSAGPNHALNPQ